ncbi:PREDICTED: proline-, glutamic acid- and leucine-rich protein 1-like isoform X1 [Amphimedon queenslandica]|uniref:Uncharacterized protein n=1 Tax=Amphimedon queenslandica TaxID=400682 RepID=A0A1X7UU44_AMPQE|nr:PREDICTED: proline-, glutamic acid- and leucine-rich protein 1-like isoform X1 [Amphimedon queenslandica]|eukprot:XP_003386861.1 PREDICTED: proline-, glutamic acid- and leucine-rich protein 1-like isoform X1 [Amphimedon queenslandica]
MDQNNQEEQQQQDEVVTIPESPHEKTPFSDSEPRQLSPAPLPPLRPPPQQRPQSTFEAGSSATLPARPLSASVDYSTGDLIYDKLPETLPRPPKSTPAPSMKPVIEEKNMAEVKQEEPVEEVEKKPPPAEEGEDDYPRDYKTCTIITMILCSLILNVFSFACLVPAYYYSSQAKLKYKDGEFDDGVKLAKRSLVLNLITVICTFLAVLLIFIIVMVAFGAAGLF